MREIELLLFCFVVFWPIVKSVLCAAYGLRVKTATVISRWKSKTRRGKYRTAATSRPNGSGSSVSRPERSPPSNARVSERHIRICLVIVFVFIPEKQNIANASSVTFRSAFTIKMVIGTCFTSSSSADAIARSRERTVL